MTHFVYCSGWDFLRIKYVREIKIPVADRSVGWLDACTVDNTNNNKKKEKEKKKEEEEKKNEKE